MVTVNEVFRDFVVDGVPSSGANKVKKAEVRKLLSGMATGGSTGLYDFLPASNTGAGTANAIQATTDVAIPDTPNGALIALPIAATNTASPVTVSFNGGAPRTIKTSGGNDPVIGGLTAGMTVAGYVSGSTFRLISDQASASIVAAAEDAAETAADYAALARNDFAVNRFAGDGVRTNFVLSADPGSGNNCLVYVDGVYQQKDTYSLSGTTITFSEAPPGDGVAENVEVAYGFQVEVGTPADGSVTEAKIGTGAVSTAKMKDGAATKQKLGSNSVDETKLDGAKAAAMLALLLGAPGGISSGSYTPTGTIVSNIDTLTPGIAYWLRVLDRVIVFGQVTVDFTAAAQADFRLSLPVASAFAASTDAAGTGSPAGAGGGLFMNADVATDTFFCRAVGLSTGAHSYSFIAMYRVN